MFALGENPFRKRLAWMTMAILVIIIVLLLTVILTYERDGDVGEDIIDVDGIRGEYGEQYASLDIYLTVNELIDTETLSIEVRLYNGDALLGATTKISTVSVLKRPGDQFVFENVKVEHSGAPKGAISADVDVYLDAEPVGGKIFLNILW